MNYRKLLMGAFSISAICLVSVFGLSEKAGAWGWYGFSELNVDGSVRGQGGGVIEFTISQATVRSQCFNVNSGQLDQPGEGNLGGLTIDVPVVTDPDKSKGIVKVAGALSLNMFDQHCATSWTPDGCVDDEISDAHYHICHPYDNVNKIEVPDTAWIDTFTAVWVWYNDKGKVINYGVDECTWTGEIINGYPTHNAGFDCVEESAKKLNFVE